MIQKRNNILLDSSPIERNNPEPFTHPSKGLRMRRSAVLAMLVLYINSHAAGQSVSTYPRTEVAAGFSVLSVGGTTRTQLFGWQAGMTTNFTRSFGLASDFAGQYSNGISVRQSLFGPQYNKRWDGKTAFAHALFGTSRLAGANAFTIGLGGGFDLKGSDRFLFRLAQVDWLPARSSGEWVTDRGRLSSSIIITFGRR
jgi:hypothetical protein